MRSLHLWSLIRGEPDVVVRCAGPLILGGMLLWFASAWFELPGGFTAAFAVVLGASGGSLVHWRTERGLWMLAGLFLVVYAAVYGLFVYGQARDIVRGARRPDAAVAIDASLATALLSANIRFLRRVAKSNRMLSRKFEDA